MQMDEIFRILFTICYYGFYGPNLRGGNFFMRYNSAVGETIASLTIMEAKLGDPLNLSIPQFCDIQGVSPGPSIESSRCQVTPVSRKAVRRTSDRRSFSSLAISTYIYIFIYLCAIYLRDVPYIYEMCHIFTRSAIYLRIISITDPCTG